MASQGFQALQPVARGVLHLSLDVAEHVHELLLATIVVLAPDAAQILVLL